MKETYQFVAIEPVHLAETGLYSVDPVAFVVVLAAVGELAESMAETIVDLAFVETSVLVVDA